MILPTIVVAGFGRCGSSLVMQMLDAGGVTCSGMAPSYEDSAVRDRVQPSYIAEWAGHAVKVLDPHRVGLPGNVRVIWLDRNEREQARSHVKFQRIMIGLPSGRHEARAIERQLPRDRRLAMRVIGDRPKLEMTFEALLLDPLSSARRIGKFIERPDFNAEAAAARVIRRSALCRTGMDIEASLLQQVVAC